MPRGCAVDPSLANGEMVGQHKAAGIRLHTKSACKVSNKGRRTGLSTKNKTVVLRDPWCSMIQQLAKIHRCLPLVFHLQSLAAQGTLLFLTGLEHVRLCIDSFGSLSLSGHHGRHHGSWPSVFCQTSLNKSHFSLKQLNYSLGPGIAP